MIFFDVDGTLIDHAKAERRAATYFVTRLRLNEHCEESFVVRWRDASERYMCLFLSGEISFEDQRRLRLRSVLGRELTRSDAVSIFDIYLRAYEASWQLFSDVLPCLNRLNAPLGIITNGNRQQQLKKLSATSIKNYFDVVVASEDIGVAKPASSIFNVASSLASLPSRSCTYVGDQLRTDAVAAVAAGWGGIWLNREAVAAPTHAGVTVISGLDELN